ncbi:MAG: hypothetical protein ABSA83_14520 [Verrucomicrobiota bacterium]|jgi:hypothetical protein
MKATSGFKTVPGFIPWKFGALLVLAGLLSGCQPTLECGTWTFTGSPNTAASPYDSFPLSSAFVFTPATCTNICDCNIDAMIQMVSVYDADEKMFLAGNGESLAWADTNGWMIDQTALGGWAEGYYGLNNDGSTFDTVFNTVGGNGTANTLFDAPGGWGPNTFFYAVDVAVCFQSSTCPNRILGYYFWSWIIDTNGVGQKFITAPAWKDLDTEFQGAVQSWNDWAPTSGPLGGGSTGEILVPHAIPFPPLSDL